MFLEERKYKIIIVGGKARHGKNTICDDIKEYANLKGLSYINLAYADYIKNYAMKISNWDGKEATKPRELLQQLGTNIIRAKYGSDFFIKMLINDLKVYKHFFDIITISDARFEDEIEYIKKEFHDVKSVLVQRKNFDNGLTKEQQNHPTETGLDNYKKFDYTIKNNGTLEDLKTKVYDMLRREYE